jgi:hypothetical protein
VQLNVGSRHIDARGRPSLFFIARLLVESHRVLHLRLLRDYARVSLDDLELGIPDCQGDYIKDIVVAELRRLFAGTTSAKTLYGFEAEERLTQISID